MKSYRVEITERAQDSIDAYAAHIEEQSGSSELARRWILRVYAAAETLRYLPGRYETAEDGVFCDYEVRRLIVGDYLVLYQVLEDDQEVVVLNFRHSSRLPRPGDLPDDPGA